MEGISNKTIANFFTEKTSDDVKKKKFIGVFPSSFATRFIIFHSMLIDSGAQYPFVIMNTDRSNKKGTHWWSFLDIHPKKKIFLFDSFSFEVFKEFILQDDQKVLNKILYGTEKFNKKGNKITLITPRFFMREYEKSKKMNRLNETTIDLLHLMNEYWEKHRLKMKLLSI